MPQLERIPPHNDEAEKSVLGSMLIDQEVYYKISEDLRAEDFYSDAHKEIFAAMDELAHRSEPIDVITVSEELKKRRTLEAAGGRSYVAALSMDIPTTANAQQYASIVKDKALLRSLISAAGDITTESFSETRDPKDVLDDAEKSIFEIAGKKQTRGYEKLDKVLSLNIRNIQELQASGGKLPGLETDYVDLDRRLAGLQKSDLIVLAARPAMGKTAFALNLAQNVALKQNARVVIFSLEMSKEQLGKRMLAMESRVTANKLRTGDLNNEDWERINGAISKLSKADIVIDDTPGIGVMEVRNKCRRINMEKQIDLIVIDYLQLMTSDKHSENRVQEVSAITKYLKQLAREIDCPVIVLSQLSRAVESTNRSDHRPMLSDLRESGSIEQDADIVMFIYREDYYRKDDAEPNNIAEIIIAKQRGGETGTTRLTWIPQFTKFANLAKMED